jgi:hypothetical protein
MQVREAIRQARTLIRESREASADGVIDELEALGLVQDSIALSRAVLGDVQLSASAKALLKAGAKELLKLLENENQ